MIQIEHQLIQTIFIINVNDIQLAAYIYIYNIYNIYNIYIYIYVYIIYSDKQLH